MKKGTMKLGGIGQDKGTPPVCYTQKIPLTTCDTPTALELPLFRHHRHYWRIRKARASHHIHTGRLRRTYFSKSPHHLSGGTTVRTCSRNCAASFACLAMAGNTFFSSFVFSTLLYLVSIHAKKINGRKTQTAQSRYRWRHVFATAFGIHKFTGRIVACLRMEV